MSARKTRRNETDKHFPVEPFVSLARRQRVVPTSLGADWRVAMQPLSFSPRCGSELPSGGHTGSVMRCVPGRCVVACDVLTCTESKRVTHSACIWPESGFLIEQD